MAGSKAMVANLRPKSQVTRWEHLLDTIKAIALLAWVFFLPVLLNYACSFMPKSGPPIVCEDEVGHQNPACER